MEGEDEILFAGKFGNFNVGLKFELGGKTESDVAYALSVISEKIDDIAYQLSGIDVEKVKKTAAVSGNGISAVVRFLSSKKPNEFRSELLSACKNELLIPVAESYFFNQLFEKAGVPYKLKPNMLSSTIPSKPEKPEDQIVLLGKYKNWISIKKLSVDSTSEGWEVSGILSAINYTIVSKAFDFIKANGVPVVISGRKSYGNVLEALKNFSPSGNAINDAYVLNKTMEGLGYRPYAHPDMLSDAHPEIKGVKLKGRKPKG